MTTLQDEAEEEFAALYDQFLKNITDPNILDRVDMLLAVGDYEGAIQVILDALDDAASDVPLYLVTLVKAHVKTLLALTGTKLVLDLTAPQLIQIYRDNRKAIVDRIADSQSRAMRAAITQSFLDGQGLKSAVHQSLGLTAGLTDAVKTFRQKLIEQNRFAKPGEGLTSQEIERMTEKYRESMINVRREQIARTSATRAISETQNYVLEAAIAEGLLEPNRINRTWQTVGDNRVRDAHDSMDGQEAGANDVFVDGYGNKLRYPGDPQAPVETTINCRCSLAITLS